MRGKRAVIVVVIAGALAGLGYAALPLVRTEAAGIACGLTLPGNGTYSVEWKPLPPAHWECLSTPAGGPAQASDLGWWP